MSNAGDLLLYALSNWRAAGWPAFKAAIDELYSRYLAQRGQEPTDPAARIHRDTLAGFEQLGHCDSDFSGGNARVLVAPPALALLPAAGFPRTVLCGARSPDTVDEIRKASASSKAQLHLAVDPQTDPFLPARIEIEAVTVRLLEQIAAGMGMTLEPTPAAWRIVQFSGTLGGYVRTLKWSSEPELNWRRLDFDPRRFALVECASQVSELRLSAYQDPVRTTWTYRLWRRESSAVVDPRWGRYAVLSSNGMSALSYDSRSATVTVPRGAPLPRLLARALTLCSGRASAITSIGAPNSPGRVAYSEVPQDIFEVVVRKLSMSAQAGKEAEEGMNE